MALETAHLHHLAHLARLDLPAEEEARLAANLRDLLGLIETLQNAAVEGVVPMAHPHDLGASLRVDEVTEPAREAALEALAPAMESGLYLVPKVIE